MRGCFWLWNSILCACVAVVLELNSTSFFYGVDAVLELLLLICTWSAMLLLT